MKCLYFFDFLPLGRDICIFLNRNPGNILISDNLSTVMGPKTKGDLVKPLLGQPDSALSLEFLLAVQTIYHVC